MLAQWVKNPTAMQGREEMWVRSLVWEDSPEKEMATHSSILAGESHGQRSLQSMQPTGYSLWGHKESDMTERLNTHTHTDTESF